MDEKKVKQIKRHKRIRKKIKGTKDCPRLCVFRGLANIQAQLIDDIKEKTLLSISTKDKEFRKKFSYGGNVKAAALLGEILAERIKEKGITHLAFDRAGFIFHGRIKALVESMRKKGLRF